jgi:hypothetical protein
MSQTGSPTGGPTGWLARELCPFCRVSILSGRRRGVWDSIFGVWTVQVPVQEYQQVIFIKVSNMYINGPYQLGQLLCPLRLVGAGIAGAGIGSSSKLINLPLSRFKLVAPANYPVDLVPFARLHGLANPECSPTWRPQWRWS